MSSSCADSTRRSTVSHPRPAKVGVDAVVARDLLGGMNIPAGDPVPDAINRLGVGREVTAVVGVLEWSELHDPAAADIVVVETPSIGINIGNCSPAQCGRRRS